MNILNILAQDPDVVLVLAVFWGGLGLIGLLAGWADGRLSPVGFITTLSAIGLLVWYHLEIGLTISAIPEAVIEIIARLIR